MDTSTADLSTKCVGSWKPLVAPTSPYTASPSTSEEAEGATTPGPAPSPSLARAPARAAAAQAWWQAQVEAQTEAETVAQAVLQELGENLDDFWTTL